MKKLALFLILVLGTVITNAQSTIYIGILSDYSSTDNVGLALNKQIISEIEKVVGLDYSVTTNKSLIKFCNYNSDLARYNYSELSKIADLIIILGPHSTKGSLQNRPFTKKTIALGVFNPKFQSIPLTKDGVSGIKNFTYINSKFSMKDELSQFKNDVNFKHLGIIIDSKTRETINLEVLKNQVNILSSILNCNITTHFVDANKLSTDVSTLPTTLDAVYTYISFEWNKTAAKTAFNQLIKLKLPSLVMNDNYLKYGGLLSYSKNTSIAYVLRKLSIVVSDALGGASMAKMEVYIKKKNETSLNTSTAKAINYSASFKTIFTANIVKSSNVSDNIQTYSVQELIKKALEENLNIAISKNDIELSENDIAISKSEFSPKLEASISALKLDKNRPNQLSGQAEYSIVAAGKLNQLIYSESAIANIAIQKHLLKAQKHAGDQEVLDQLLSVFKSYFSLLKAKTNLAIQQENYDATKHNLELAEKRNTLGTTNQSDLYRWQSEMASYQQQVIEANTNLLALKYQLNTLLNNSLADEFDIKDISEDNSVLNWFQNSGLEKAINTPASLHKLIKFFTKESINSYPSKKQLLSNIDAIERQKLMNKRLLYTPTIALQGQINQNIYRGGIASTPIAGSKFYNNTWDIGLSVVYPIFQGNKRKLNLKKNTIELDQLNKESDRLSQNLKLQVKLNTLDIIASKTNIKNTKIAKENAEENFKLVQQNYQLGTIDITQLIDAQKNLFSLRQAHSIAVYEYLFNFINLENAIGFYSILATEKEKNEFQNRYLNFISNN